MQKKILIIAPNDQHLSNFICHLNSVKNDSYTVDHFALSYQRSDAPFSKTFSISKHFPSFFYDKWILGFTRYADLVLSFRKLQGSYDLVNIHFVTIDSFFLLPLIKRKAKKLFLTPWGSDALRVNNKIFIAALKRLYAAADDVTLADIRFRQDVMRKFNVSPNKIVDLSYGASMIDYIAENSISTTEAKKKLGLENIFTISAGYNRSPLQNHIHIINAVIACKNQLPENIVMLFPFTYNGNIEPYKSELVELLDAHQIKSIFCESFLEAENLRNLVYATDVFIHVQETDANSASLQEYILAGKTVINGSWLQYDQLEKTTYPYYLAKDKNHIDVVLQEVIENNYQSKVNNYHLEEIKKFGWKQKAIEWNRFYEKL